MQGRPNLRSEEFTLRSGTVLKISTPPFEKAISLIEAMKAVTKSLSEEARESEVDQALFASAKVRAAVFQVSDTALWGIHRVTPQLMDDAKVGLQARSDYFEIVARVCTFVSKDFFLTTPSSSTTNQPVNSESQKSLSQ